MIARGGGMADRSAHDARAMREQQEAYIRETVGKATPADQITQAQALLARGDITESEFAALKAKALA
jgi:hypothetical protein